jgi:hypothetical protein
MRHNRSDGVKRPSHVSWAAEQLAGTLAWLKVQPTTLTLHTPTHIDHVQSRNMQVCSPLKANAVHLRHILNGVTQHKATDQMKLVQEAAERKHHRIVWHRCFLQ